MQNCVDCITPINSKCVHSEKKFSATDGNLDELLLHLDANIQNIFKILEADVDNKSFKETKYVTEYIQQIINKLDALTSAVEKVDPAAKFTIKSELTGDTPRTLLQILTIFAKEIEGLKKGNISLTSSLYTPNV